jgi:hypothetical protein
MSACPPVRMYERGPTGRIAVKFGIEEFYENIS